MQAGALILRLSVEFAVWAEGDEYNEEKTEERSEGELGMEESAWVSG